MRIYILGFVLLLTSFSYSQNKKDILDGIFDIRLGMTVDEIKAVVDTNLLTNEGAVKYTLKKATNIASRNRSFHLEEYIPKANLDYKIQNIRFRFFDDKLYMIEIDENSSRTVRLLTDKYGQPKETIETKNIVGTESQWYKKEWKTNHKNIICEYLIMKNNREDGVVSTFYNLTICNTKVLGIITELAINEELDSLEKEDTMLLDKL